MTQLRVHPFGDFIEDESQAIHHSVKRVIGDGNRPYVFAGRRGAGKDSGCLAVLQNDLLQGRVPVALDLKIDDYGQTIFPMLDGAILSKFGNLLGRGHDVTLWLPYTQGMDKKESFIRLLKSKHPNLTIRPFRLYIPDCLSEDSYLLTTAMTQLQAGAITAGMEKDETRRLPKLMRQSMEMKEQIAQQALIFDNIYRWWDGCGWEYLNVRDAFMNQDPPQINVIGFWFLYIQNKIVATSMMNAMLSELFALGTQPIAKVVALFIPEYQVIMPLRIKSLSQIVEVIIFQLISALLLGRHFYSRPRINGQNISFLPSDLWSQPTIFVGKTQNPKDLAIYKNSFGFNEDDLAVIRTLETGNFVTLEDKTHFGIFPTCHKAQEQESLISTKNKIGLLERFQENPIAYTFKIDKTTRVSELADRTMSGERYNQYIRDWLEEIPDVKVQPIDFKKKGVQDENLSKLNRREFRSLSMQRHLRLGLNPREALVLMSKERINTSIKAIARESVEEMAEKVGIDEELLMGLVDRNYGQIMEEIGG